jgi:hypothetical protein
MLLDVELSGNAYVLFKYLPRIRDAKRFSRILTG